MADPKPSPREEATEERTEPFSQSELDARIRAVDVSASGPSPDQEHVPLDVLLLEDHHHRQNIRLLVRPFAELPSLPAAPSSGNCRWLALRAEIASSDQPSHKVLAVQQTARDIKFSVRVPASVIDPADTLICPSLWCELYFDPASDKLILVNRSEVPIALVRLSQTAPASPSLNDYPIVYPHVTKSLEPGTWRIKVCETAVLDFRILEKRPVILYEQPPLSHSQSTFSRGSSLVSTSGKRALTPDDEDEGDKRVKRRVSQVEGRAADGLVMFLNPSADPLVFSLPNGAKKAGKELAAGNNTNALLDAEQGDTVYMTGICELDEYQLIKQEPIASTAQSAVFVGRHSKRPDNIVTVKVLKTVVSGSDKPNVHERNVIRQADMWQREYQTQENLQHHSIVRYYGGDARFLSLYMEHVDAKDLTVQNRWRSKQDDHFTGSREDATRILRDISSALSYIHGRQLVHNDIKPANVLYSLERGAVLCDFGMSTATASPPSGGGTPYYIPPEFIGRKLRGPAADVWAMGVTMLYLLRKLPLPESRARPQSGKPLYWLIAGVNNPQALQKYGNGQPAILQMRAWLTEVHDAAQKLDKDDRLERIVREMLTPNPTQRITMPSILEQLTSGL
ncbi:Protein kinase-like domain protein [Cordyceps fumosorosea ARSEF 2679]|uniref:Protein kinase-like domain protein n=1 Tax=Cordyceps fumosorosea (strain ARSEF 2679) TaxID=1081104 RepID=A0A167V2G3_CORFA|nr:Protein kinase-like domain protein [Cordyceps fumosorosea ARSEF 2679]OAA62158.1 Protein kinase-like domain protein [Cordyceps fumosorosea ARSEF 2679]